MTTLAVIGEIRAALPAAEARSSCCLECRDKAIGKLIRPHLAELLALAEAALRIQAAYTARTDIAGVYGAVTDAMIDLEKHA